MHQKLRPRARTVPFPGYLSRPLLVRSASTRLSIESTLLQAHHQLHVRACHPHLRFNTLQTIISLEIRRSSFCFVHRGTLMGGYDVRHFQAGPYTIFSLTILSCANHGVTNRIYRNSSSSICFIPIQVDVQMPAGFTHPT